MSRAAPSTPLPKVIYIAGWGRSGSTILDQILGAIDGWFSCGELNLVWWDLDCGCGVPVSECDFWQPILDDVFARYPESQADLIALWERLGANPSSLTAIARESRRPHPGGSPLRRHASLLCDLYRSAAAQSGAGVLVDSSKMASYAYLLSELTDLDLYVVHLVRDPRATAHAWGKRKLKSYDPPVYFGRYGPMGSSLQWLRRNGVIDAVVRRRLGDRYILLRYEDFVANPAAAVRSICRLAGETPARLPFADGRGTVLPPNHTVAGNPARFATGELEIRADEEWRSQMKAHAKLLATAPAVPLLHRYGYPLRSP